MNSSVAQFRHRLQPRARVVAGILALVLTVLFAPGVGLASSNHAYAATKMTQAQAESMFRSAGITWSSSGGCTNRNVSTCTSFDQLNLTTAQGAVTLKNSSGCALNITGGTETGHASGTYSHWNGYKLDFGKVTCLTNYIKAYFSYSGLRSDGYQMWTSGAGNVYTDEGNHWDVVYYNCGGC
ncbi:MULTISPECIES: hypothetical protein [Streptomyces]|uniref:hypothetical protein n=1 Tax=Streptomyces TaxID=1883 RepID=UPI000A717015|nr:MULTISPECIES: hypothetical protein [Streptomyces]MBB4796036.1 hypothetical protein [Streptomyces nodosus]